ncbi:MAG: VWA domain-containing protein [Cyanobacteria bacterium SZAS LIN-2]|nr:VWA domain-containing protein [Cyanobacteria bacterium SZAS LIN-2]
MLLPLLFLLKKRGYLGFSDSRLLGGSSRTLRWLSRLPLVLACLAVTLLVVALARPQVPGEPVHKTVPGRDIILAVDISYSMTFPFKGKLEPHQTPAELEFKTPYLERRHVEKGLQFVAPKEGLQRIHPLQNALLRFIENRWAEKTGDRIGLILFDVRPRYGWPLTDDLRQLYRKAQFIQNNLGTGTNFGDDPPGPVDLAVEHFQESGQAKSKVLILVTDGEDRITTETKAHLVSLLTENNIRLYLVGVGETLATKDVDIVKVADSVGGKVFRVENAGAMADCFAAIDRMEKSEVTVSEMETRDDIFFYFVWAALGAFLLFLLSEVFILTR